MIDYDYDRTELDIITACVPDNVLSKDITTHNGSVLNGTFVIRKDNSQLSGGLQYYRISYKDGRYHGKLEFFQDGKFVTINEFVYGHNMSSRRGVRGDQEYIKWMQEQEISLDQTAWTDDQRTLVLLTWG